MRTTVDLDDDLVTAALSATGAATKRAVLELGLKALIAKAERDRAIALGGTMPDVVGPPRRRSGG